MEKINSETAIKLINQTKTLTFLTGAGVSTASGIPDYRSLTGFYRGIERPEYLLSYTCMQEEPEKFYSFIKNLYHPEARPNIIHKKIAELENKKSSWVISQNIDGLHALAGSKNSINFHGNLYDCYCRKCGQKVSGEDYLLSNWHNQCGGQVRPKIVLYEEGLDEQAIAKSIQIIEETELLIIVGTSFQVHPFCDLVDYAPSKTKILVINQTPIQLKRPAYFLQDDAIHVFENIG